MRTLAVALLALAALAAAGCAATMKDVYAGKAEGKAFAYPLTPEKAWEISGEILWEASQSAPEEHPDHQFLCVKAGLGDDETFIGVWVEPREKAGECLVTVVSRRKSGLQSASRLTEDEFHEKLRRAASVKPVR